MQKKKKEKINLLGINVDNVPVENLLEFCKKTIAGNEKAVISNVNIHAMNLAYENAWFRSFINHSQIVFCDGTGVMLGTYLTGQRLNYRYTPPDWINLLCGMAVDNDWKLYMLGSKPDVIESAAERLRQNHLGLSVSAHNGYFDKQGAENEFIIHDINAFRTNILLVGMGMPLQEKWIAENYDKLQVNIFMPVGALFDYIAKAVPRAPRFMTDNGFEWLARLLIEPKRLWRRYLIGNPLFFYRIFIHHIWKKEHQRSSC